MMNREFMNAVRNIQASVSQKNGTEIHLRNGSPSGKIKDIFVSGTEIVINDPRMFADAIHDCLCADISPTLEGKAEINLRYSMGGDL